MNTITIKQERLLELICEVLYEEGELGQESEFPEEMIDSAANELLDDLSTLEEQDDPEGFYTKLLDSLKSLFINNNIPKEDEEEFEELVLLRAQEKAKRLKQFGLAGILGGFMAATGIGIDYQQDIARQARHQETGQETFEQALEDFKAEQANYDGPKFPEGQKDYYKDIDFSGHIKSLEDTTDPFAKIIIQGRRAPSIYYVDMDALKYEPIPKYKFDTGEEAERMFDLRFDALPEHRKITHLVGIYQDLTKIGQVGLGDARWTLNTVLNNGKPVQVLPVEFSFLLDFLTNSVHELSTPSQIEFFKRIGKQEQRLRMLTWYGQKKAIEYGYDLALAGKEIDKNNPYYLNQRDFVLQGYAAGKQENPTMPSPPNIPYGPDGTVDEKPKDK